MDAELSARERANAEQRVASDPAVSAFVSASAGSGKTKLLTDRLLRLMLGGADPGRIQCLTYTRAAAAEMALRLQAVLGRWVTLPDTKLDAALRALDIAPSPAARAQARALFAEVLDLPGGMRIGTIHAFCQSLLRRFPLEAQISPHFRLIEDAQADAARRDAEEQALAPAAPQGDGATRPASVAAGQQALQRIAGLSSLAQFDALVRAMLEDRPRLAALLTTPQAEIEQRQRAALCATGEAQAVLAGAIAWAEETAVREALVEIAEHGPPGRTAPAAASRLLWLAGHAMARAARWSEYAESFFTKEGDPCSWKTLVGEKLAKQRPGLRAAMQAEQDRVLAIREALRAAACAAASAALVELARPIAAAYAHGKQQAIRLDYADLIDRTIALLLDPGAAWVLYKLDGGLDHLLLDEVQDTAPAQWRIAGRLVEEFFAGQGARPESLGAGRSVFAVGDAKQSIFSFQGADPAAFAGWRDRLAAQVRGGGGQWRAVTLDVSFRSTAPVLALVDRVFAAPAAAEGVLVAGEVLEHRSDRAGQAGAVELWPLVEPPEREEPPAWQVPRERQRSKSAPQLLAETLATWIARETDGSVQLPSRGRPLRPGDVLVLVQTRTDLGRALVRALKHLGVPVAGLDRMQLAEQPAVADLLALCDVLLLPQDDLSLGCVLTSPLGGLTDDSLMALAAPRSGTLWDALRQRGDERPDWAAARDWLAALFARVDFVPPHALLGEALGALGGRARLLARLGPEAAEPIDELLAAALDYARNEPPSLQGFLHWVRRSAAEVKREPAGDGGEAGPGMVRIMTVHGAKGLQAPLVILPDTTRLPREDAALLWSGGEGQAVPLWAPLKDLRCSHVDALRQAQAAARMAEYRRLLYVALTRAEDRLVVCGYAPRKSVPDECWYRLIESGFAGLEPQRRGFEAWSGELLLHDCVQSAAPDRPASQLAAPDAAVLPGWAGAAPAWTGSPPPAEPALPQRLAPSRPQDASFGPVPAAASPLAAGDREARFRRGKLLHTLLQHLPEVAPAARAAAARRFLARPGILADPAEAEAMLADLRSVLEHPALAPLFGPGGRAEVPLTGVVGGGAVVGGLVDRLAVLEDRVLLADYKTARTPPGRVEDVPVLYLRQMAAYRAVLAAEFPGRAVECLLVWTTGAQVMTLPQALLDSHAPPGVRG